jgi:hypothetical protein
LLIGWPGVIVKVVPVLPLLKPKIKRMKCRLHCDSLLFFGSLAGSFDDFE